MLLALAAGIAWYERSRPPSRLVALVAALAALALAGRVLFTPLPNVQATTDIVLLSGYALGPLPGFMVGSVGALASNFFLGQGPWTPWQMLGWGMAGVAGGALAAVAGRRLHRFPLALACALAGLAFGAWMDLFTLVNFAAERSGRSYVAIAGVSLPFNVAHAAGNAVLCLALGPGFVRTLTRFRQRMQVSWTALDERSALARSHGAGTAAVVVALCVLPGAAAAALAEQARAARAPAAAPAAAPLRYLERAQNADGGFGGAKGQPSSQLITGWAALGLEAAGRNPLDVRRVEASPLDYMRAHARELNDTGELERTILVVRGAGLSARSFAGRDLVSELLRKRRADGSFDRLANITAFGILALRAAGRSASSPAVTGSARWLARQQNSDGGFSAGPRGGASFVDETGAALQALASAGPSRSGVARRAVAYLRRVQNADGGLGQAKGYPSNAQSTAWAIQGAVAAHADPRRISRHGSRSLAAYLRSLRQPDGSFRYSRTSTQTPVWVTAQALAAVKGKPLPYAPAARRRAARTRTATRSHTPARTVRAAPARRSDHRGLQGVRDRSTGEKPARAASTLAARPVSAVETEQRHAGGGLGPLAIAGIAAGGLALGAAAGLIVRRRRSGLP